MRFGFVRNDILERGWGTPPEDGEDHVFQPAQRGQAQGQPAPERPRAAKPSGTKS